MRDNAYRNVRRTALVTALCLIGDSMLYVLLPIYYLEFGLTSLWQVGALLAANRFIRIPFGPLVSWVIARTDTRLIFLICILLASATTCAYGVVKGFAGLLAVRFVWGLVWCALRMTGYISVLDNSDGSDSGRLMGVYTSVFRIGSLIGMVGGGLLANFMGPFVPPMLFAGVMLLGLPLSLRLPGSKGSLLRIHEGQIGTLPIKRLRVWAVWGMALIAAFSTQGVFTSSYTRLLADSGHFPLELGFAAVGVAAAAAAAQLVKWCLDPWFAPWVGGLSDGRSGRGPVLIGGMLAAAVGYVLLSLPLSVGIMLALIMGMMLSGTALATVTDALATDIVRGGHDGVRSLSGHALAIDLGAAAGPLAAYAAAERIGFSGVCIGSALLLGFGMLAWLAASKRLAVKAEAGAGANSGPAAS